MPLAGDGFQFKEHANTESPVSEVMNLRIRGFLFKFLGGAKLRIARSAYLKTLALCAEPWTSRDDSGL